MTTGHDRFKEQLPGYALGALDPAEQSDLERHLEGCAECRAELAWLEPAGVVLAADIEQVEPAPDLRSRVMAAVDEEMAVSERPATVPAPGKKRSSPGSGWLSGLLRPAVLGAAAAALFVGVALGLALNDDRAPTGPQRQVVTGQSTIGADAVMVASEGTGTLKMTGLRQPSEDEVYQAWIQRGQSVIPTDSLFVPDRRGSATASFPDLTGVTAVMVSLEPRGGSRQPTTAPVISVSMPG